jgi:anti-sigma regulatory factor (Ser/Thr protein kinase)
MAMQDEAGRLESLKKYRILDTEPEQAFDDLTLIASQVCSTPIALISLVDEDRQWFKSRVGLEATETKRSISFCGHAIGQDGLFVVEDAAADERFKENPLVVGEPHIRFYAGMPLKSREGMALGTLCVIDREPRTLSESQREALAALKRQVESQLELRRNLDDLKVAVESIEMLSGLTPYCSACELNMTIPAEAEAIGQVSAGVRALLQRHGWDEGEVMRVELSVQEALANAIKHGCGGDASKQVQCTVSFEPKGEVVVVVRDPGPGFDPHKVPDPLAESNLLRGSGRGVFLINELMDTVEYADQGRQVEMRKKRAVVQ